jgi:lipid A disaccharide synthetase
LIKIPYVGLANIIADRLIIPELIQHNLLAAKDITLQSAANTNKSNTTSNSQPFAFGGYFEMFLEWEFDQI